MKRIQTPQAPCFYHSIMQLSYYAVDTDHASAMLCSYDNAAILLRGAYKLHRCFAFFLQQRSYLITWRIQTMQVLCFCPSTMQLSYNTTNTNPAGAMLLYLKKTAILLCGGYKSCRRQAFVLRQCSYFIMRWIKTSQTPKFILTTRRMQAPWAPSISF